MRWISARGLSAAERGGFGLRAALTAGAILVLAILLALIVYACIGYFDALRDSARLKQRADALIDQGRGPNALIPRRLEQLLRVEDPAFWRHDGVDVETSGAGLTTLTQSLSKRLAFSEFKPGIGKIRQTAYALGLERRLSKEEILALFLDTAELGRGPVGWMKGMFDASAQVYGKAPTDLTDRQWLALVAVLIAPGKFNLMAPDDQLNDRIDRIERLVAGKCRPRGERDVWLEGCA